MNITLDPVDFLNFGDVFYLEIPGVEGIHYMVVVNSCPQENEVIVLGVITSKVEKRKEFIRLAGKNPLSFSRSSCTMVTAKQFTGRNGIWLISVSNTTPTRCAGKPLSR